MLEADGIDGSSLAVVGGALDGVERVAAAWLHPGDRVWWRIRLHRSLDLLIALGLEVVPVGVDEHGIRPDLLARRWSGDVTPPWSRRVRRTDGHRLDRARTAELRAVLAIIDCWSSKTTMPVPRGCTARTIGGSGPAGPPSARYPSGSLPTCGWRPGR